jgi:hypothetical protein
MPPRNVCTWINQQSALTTFATYSGPTQSQQHIKPLHYYVACRLVVEGGFLPEEITPRPPFRAQRDRDGWQLIYDPDVATGSERMLLGGLKTKDVDVVIIKNGLGPAMAVSCKGAIGAFRNLTNRMEEAVGDCTNLHITYPAMVTGFLFVLRAHRHDAMVAAEATRRGTPAPGCGVGLNDIAISKSGEPVKAIVRFHNALRELTGRRGIRDDVSRYESVSLGSSIRQDHPPGRCSRAIRPRTARCGSSSSSIRCTCAMTSATSTAPQTLRASHGGANGRRNRVR